MLSSLVAFPLAALEGLASFLRDKFGSGTEASIENPTVRSAVVVACLFHSLIAKGSAYPPTLVRGQCVRACVRIEPIKREEGSACARRETQSHENLTFYEILKKSKKRLLRFSCFL